MRRDLLALMHAGYWALYVLLHGLVLVMVRFAHQPGRPLAGLLAAWPIVVQSVVPNVVAFYTAYSLLFSRFLVPKRYAALAAAGGALCLAAAAVGLGLA